MNVLAHNKGSKDQEVSAQVACENLTLGYDGHPAVHHLSGAFTPGSPTAVCGPNGAGKSTLLKGLIGALKPLSGRVILNHCDHGDIAYMPQAAAVEASFPLDVYSMTALGAAPRVGLFKTIDVHEKISQALAAVGLHGFERRLISELSGGQKQRLLFARLMVQDAPILFLDEPFAALDAVTTADLLKIIAHWAQENRTIVAVLHDEALVRGHFPQTLLLAREPLGWGATQDVLTPGLLAQARLMSEAFDETSPLCGRAA